MSNEDHSPWPEAHEILHRRITSSAKKNSVGGGSWALLVGDEILDGRFGYNDSPTDAVPTPINAMYRIASVSKPIVAVAGLQLVDEGLMGLDDAVDHVLPELADRSVLVDSTGAVDGPTKPAERSLVLRDLLTFRCGLGMSLDFETPQPLTERMWELGVGPSPTAPECTPDQYMARLADLPLAAQPGERWLYHTGSDILGVLIERIRGATLDRILEQDILGPLGMADTTFWVSPDKLGRLGNCRMDGTGTLPAESASPLWDESSGRWSASPLFRSGATGLVSTPADLVRFGRMLLNRGQGIGNRILSEELVGEMTRDYLTDLQRHDARIEPEPDAMGWGLGVGVRAVAHRAGWPGVGSYGWDGGLGTRWLVDPDRAVCAVICTTDAFRGPVTPAIMDDFVSAIVEAVDAI